MRDEPKKRIFTNNWRCDEDEEVDVASLPGLLFIGLSAKFLQMGLVWFVYNSMDKYHQIWIIFIHSFSVQNDFFRSRLLSLRGSNRNMWKRLESKL